MRLILLVVVNALALWVADLLLGGIDVGGSDSTDYAVNLLAIGAILGVVNAIIRPVVRVLSIPFIVLTLGVFWLVINALMLMLAGAIAGAVGLDFTVSGFWAALFGSIVISLALMVLEALLPAKA